MQHSGKSELAKAVRIAAIQAHEGQSNDYDKVYHGCEYNSGGCRLAPALEALFAGILSQKLANRLLQIEEGWKECEILYAPHLRSERRVGFDYSIGHFAGLKRVRWMHKHAAKWCDSQFTWKPKSSEVERCRNHALLLLEQWNLEPDNMRPFFILSFCYCLHEYRRMGQGGIPSVEDRSRWIIADLRPLGGWKDNQVRAGSFVFQRDQEGESAHWKSETESIELPLMTLDNFLEDQAAFLSQAHP